MVNERRSVVKESEEGEAYSEGMWTSDFTAVYLPRHSTCFDVLPPGLAAKVAGLAGCSGQEGTIVVYFILGGEKQTDQVGEVILGDVCMPL
ncbi:hypothetical protein Pmani_002417 [Petrolisthes manimaculis]|uniref:Uncharacterized protein n=1 Tax=Petrolisthes manimaculis TaxID=1843537 RepID=A0AAE1QHY8_9EUCA|nr:hypothetical protein Pmani_002417 [Petrolisthes manimaculis]